MKGKEQIKEMMQKAREWAFKNLSGTKIYHKDIEDYIIFNKAGIKHAIYSRTYEMKIELIYKAAELLKSSTLYEIVKDKQNRPDIKNIYKFVSNYKKDEKDFFVYIIVRETKDGKFYYDHGIIKEKF